MKSVAYIAISPSGKSYVGITKKTLAQRWTAHVWFAKRKRGSALQGAIRKYGQESFELKVLVHADWKYLVELEPKLIRSLGTRAPRGYNITSGGEQCDANAGRTLSPKWRRNLSAAQRRRWAKLNKEERSAIAKKSWANSDPNRRARHSERTKQLHQDPVWSAEWKRKLLAGRARKAAK